MGSKINWNAQSVWYCINTCVIYQKITAPYSKPIKINKTWWANQLVSTNQLTSPTAKFNHHEKIQVQKWANYATKHRHFGMEMAWVLFNQTWHHSDRVRPWSRLFLAIISMTKLLLKISDILTFRSRELNRPDIHPRMLDLIFPGGNFPETAPPSHPSPSCFSEGGTSERYSTKLLCKHFLFLTR